MKIETKIIAKFQYNEVASVNPFIDFLNKMDDDEFNDLSRLFYDEINVDLEQIYDDINRIRDYMRNNQI